MKKINLNTVKAKLVITAILCLFVKVHFCQNNSQQKPTLVLKLPIIDAPFAKYQTLEDPSMQQALDLSTNFYSAGNYFINKSFKNKPKYKVVRFAAKELSLTFFNLLAYNAPLGTTWVHEEFHRNSMTIEKVKSYNEVYDFKYILNPTQAPAVTRVKDEDLSRFKQQSQANFVRLKSAGIEAETMLPIALQNNNFYYKLNIPNTITNLLSNIGTYIYLNSSSQLVDRAIDFNSERDFNKVILKRDFAGVDFTAWIYDLNRPNEPYNSRGIHPSGNGIKRYIWSSDLTAEEINYLKKMANRQLLNLVSPMNFFVSSIKVNENLRFNFGFQHFLTSFGDNTGLRVLINNRKTNWYFAFHGNQNKKSYFPAIEAHLINYPITINNKKIDFTAKAIIGTQPKNQSFTTTKSQFIGSAGIEVTYPLSQNISTYINVNYKTAGWVAGNPFLGSNTALTIGIKTQFYK